MKKKRHRKRRRSPNVWKRHQLSDADLSSIIKATATAFDMFERGLRPMPLEIAHPFEEQTFSGDTWETSWYFADQLLLISMTADAKKMQIKFDILTDDYKFATTLADIPILAHLELEVTPVDTPLSNDTRYNHIPEGVQLWRVHSVDFQAYPENILQMLFLSEEVDTDNGEQHDTEE